jgi:hypothetical protein
MKIIKVSSGKSEFNNLLLRQTSGMNGVWGDCKFILNSEIKKCDWWFVLHGSGLIKNEECLCDPNHIVYVSMEPNETMSKVSNNFLEQFSHLVTCDRDVKHSNKIYQNWLSWWVGINVVRSKEGYFSKNFNLDYDDFISMKPVEKLDKISIVYSNKNMSMGHSKRITFLNALIHSNISQYIDVFGDGFAPIPDKWDAIVKYKYHLVIENEIQEDYWSEKLADAYIGFAFPIYSGCPNIGDYFDKDALMEINIDDLDQSIKMIKNIINKGYYEKNLKKITESRAKVLNHYNIFNLMSNMAKVEATSLEKIKLKTNYFYSDSIPKKIVRYFLNKYKN